MDKIPIGDAACTSAAKDFRNIELMNIMRLHFWNETSNSCKEITGCGISNTEADGAMERLFKTEKVDIAQFVDWDLAVLLDYITQNYHQFARKNAIAIYELAQKVAYRHSGAHPELNKLISIMFLFLHDLLNHVAKEEKILFPQIRQLLKMNREAGNGMYTTFGLIKEWVEDMRKEHQISCQKLELLNELTSNYSTPSDASDSHRSLFRLMKDFETDFLSLVQFENNIIFPRALMEDGEKC